jgi:hypothetical protein
MSVVHLENWAVVASRRAAHAGLPPAVHLRGVVFDHPCVPDGREITTSHITHRKGRLLISHNGTHYALGHINPEYDARYPESENGLLKRLPEKWEEDTVPMAQPTIQSCCG